MEGYSVTEAASVLGVPTERVWELLARGVLAGRPEGETGMRVFLQPRPASAPSTMEMPPPTPPPAREPERELSPFRELLTEFRNLTERYGQALLALGEARGEVASLRSRVDLLEARMDLRLPMGAAVEPPTGWASPARPMFEPSLEPPLVSDAEPIADTVATNEPAVAAGPAGDGQARTDELARAEEPVIEEREERTETAEQPDQVAEEPDEAEPAGAVAAAGAEAGEADEADEAEEADEAADRQRRRRGSHHATESFAEALARAEDPTVPELPEPHREPVVEAAADGGLPRELPAAEPMPTVDDETMAMASTAGAEPVPGLAAHRFDGEPAGAGWEPRSEEAPSGVEAAMPDEASEVGEPAETAELQPAWPTADGELVEAPSEVAARSEDWREAGDHDEDAFVAEFEEQQDIEAAEDDTDDAATAAGPRAEASMEGPATPLGWDPERYTTAIGEPDWYADEEEVGQPFARPEAPDEGSAFAAAEHREDEPVEEPEEGGSGGAPVPQAASDLGAADGSTEMEVAGSGHVPEQQDIDAVAGDARGSEGAAEDALAALDALGRSVGQDAVTPPPAAWPPPRSDAGQASRPYDPVAEYRSGAIGSVRPTPTPATRAYRRLRRIFPG